MSNPELDLSKHKLLIANRGEIAYRILRTAHRLGLPTVTIYTHSDATSPHVLYSSPSHLPNSVSIPLSPHVTDQIANSRAYLDGDQILAIAKAEGATLLIPGYGFLSENSKFAKKVVDSGIIWLGPRPETIRSMGLKHLARELAISAGVPVVPGSEGLVHDVETAVEWGRKIGWPVMLKATGGGGGMGIVVCEGEDEMRKVFDKTGERAEVSFGEGHGGLFVEKFVKEGRHVEVQIFGNGMGHCIHFGERECSVQRRRQKVIEETPSPFMLRHPDIRDEMCAAAARLCSEISYTSASTCEFIVDNQTGKYFFLELNARLQVEHTITEAVHSAHDLDLVELMIRQGVAEFEARVLGKQGGLAPEVLDQSKYGPVPENKHAIQCRIYCEDAARGFVPCPGILQEVVWPETNEGNGVRIDGWVSRGTHITPFFDPLAAKLIVSSTSTSSIPARDITLENTLATLSQTHLHGPPNNLHYLSTVLSSPIFRAGNALTTTLDTFTYTPHALSILEPGLASSVQQAPGRERVFGIPKSGPLDTLAPRVANLLVGNDADVEVIEVTLKGPKVYFWVDAVVAISGASVKMKVSGKDEEGKKQEREVGMWTRLVMRSGETLHIGMIGGGGGEGGYRAYLAVRGGFPEVPSYLGSKSTSLGVGGYQGRNLAPNDQLVLSSSGGPTADELSTNATVMIPEDMRPSYSTEHTLTVVAGPHADASVLTEEGLRAFFGTGWKVSPSSNRMGIRLEGPKLDWARKDGGMGGSHPSNLLDNGYAYGAVNINGDTPVLLTAEGPSMGGYVCVATVTTGDLWRLGQLRPGDVVRFRRVSLKDAKRLEEHNAAYIRSIADFVSGSSSDSRSDVLTVDSFIPAHDSEIPASPIMAVIPFDPKTRRPKVVYRQAGDRFMLIEYGEDEVDLEVRARIHLFEREVERRRANGEGDEGRRLSAVVSLAPCVRSTMVCMDPNVVDQYDLLETLMDIEKSLPDSLKDVVFPGRLLTLPIVLDDRWNREAVERYMRSARNKASYLPSNIQYLAETNGLSGGADEALQKLISSEWITVGAGFYFDCPFLVPVDPRARLTGSKYNPSRTYTPRGALGIAGPIAAIYPIESPGGYQLFGRTLPPWSPWGKGPDFSEDVPWLLRFFDQIRFEPVTEEEYEKLERDFDAGTYKFKIEDKPFVVNDYIRFIESIKDEIQVFREKQVRSVKEMSDREDKLLKEWEDEKAAETRKVPSQGGDAGDDSASPAIISTMAAAIWKIRVQPGDVIKDADQVIVTLEAMKTEIDVPAEEEFVGKTVKRVLVKEGDVVGSGDRLVVFD